MKKYKQHIKNIVISAFFLSVLLLLPRSSFAQTTEPEIKTTQTPFGQSIVVKFPQNYSGQVTSTFDGTSWRTETKKYTQADIDVMNKAIEEQQKTFQKLFEEQQKFWQQLWNSWPSFWF
jgi:hypothetical protein